MAEIQIGTDGWQAIIASDFTVENLQRAAQATAEWMLKQNYKKVIIGFDCRFGGKMFSRKVAKIMAAYDFDVQVTEKFVTTAMVANGVLQLEADIGIYISGGSKPYFFSGYKLIAKDGGRLVHDIESYIKDTYLFETESLKSYKATGKIEVIDLEEIYFQRAIDHFDLEAIRKAKLRVVVDAMYGATHVIWERILPESLRLRCEHNPLFKEETPDPLPSKLPTLAYLVGDTPYTCLGVGFGGAGERLTICDETGKFVDLDRIKAQLPSLSEVEDGVWIAMTILQEIASSGKKLSEF